LVLLLRGSIQPGSKKINVDYVERVLGEGDRLQRLLVAAPSERSVGGGRVPGRDYPFAVSSAP
jgi:hypothetical protein